MALDSIAEFSPLRPSSEQDTQAQFFEGMEFAVECPLCFSRKFSREFPPDVSRCEDCRVLFHDPRPPQSEILRFYNAGKNYASWAPQRVAREAMWHRRLRLVLRFKRKGSLLDVGTGDGHFLLWAKEAGFDGIGTELSGTAGSIARQSGADVRQGALRDIDFKGQRFDVITAWHVLEHMFDPGVALRRVSELLAEDGILVIAVPNEENRLFRCRIGIVEKKNLWPPLGSGPEIHLIHFQPSTFRCALNRFGFRVLRFGVDDVYMDRRVANLAKLAGQRAVSLFTGWHFSMAMYAVAALRGHKNRD